jgi:hypothetical protein
MAAPSAAEPLAAANCPGGAPVVQLANPGPGDVLSQGDYIVSGTAFDPSATQGSGIDRIEIFLGDRDSGGVMVGQATPGQGSSNPRTFQTTITIPHTASGRRDFVVYADSSVNGQQSSESVPVYVGAAPTPTPMTSNAPTPVPLSTDTRSTCGGTVVSVPAPTVAAVSNADPSPGDVLPNGDVNAESVANDPSASQAAGVDLDLYPRP